jgi:hypothetical protein
MIDECDYGAIGGMKIPRGNRSTRRKPAPAPLCPPQIPHDQTRVQTRAPSMGSQRLTAWAMARPILFQLSVYTLPHHIILITNFTLLWNITMSTKMTELYNCFSHRINIIQSNSKSYGKLCEHLSRSFGTENVKNNCLISSYWNHHNVTSSYCIHLWLTLLLTARQR